MSDWRCIDTGLRHAAENIALNRAMLDARREGHAPNTLRFLRFTPSALLGFHQSAEQELHLGYCHEHQIKIQRRITGGGAIYFDEAHLGWELYLDRNVLGCADLGAVSRHICTAAAEGIHALGVDARFRPRNDIEVDGRKISGTGGLFDGQALLFQGTLLLDLDVEKMVRILRIPAEKLVDKAVQSVRERVIDLRTLLGEIPELELVKAALTQAFASAFNVRFVHHDALNEHEQSGFAHALAEIDSHEWVYEIRRPLSDAPVREALHRSRGGLMRAQVVLDQRRQRISQVWITGDFFLHPARAVLDLEASLRGIPFGEVEQAIQGFFRDNTVDLLMLQPDDFVTVLNRAIHERQVITE